MTAGKYARTLLRKVGNLLGMQKLSDQIADAKVILAKALIARMKSAGVVQDLREVEFKVFSQFGDDGIIQYLVHHTGIGPGERTFVEFGVESYEESNTRFLLVNDNWRGLGME